VLSLSNLPFPKCHLRIGTSFCKMSMPCRVGQEVPHVTRCLLTTYQKKNCLLCVYSICTGAEEMALLSKPCRLPYPRCLLHITTGLLLFTFCLFFHIFCAPFLSPLPILYPFKKKTKTVSSAPIYDHYHS